MTKVQLPNNFETNPSQYVLCTVKEKDGEYITAEQKGIATWIKANIVFPLFYRKSANPYKFETILSSLEQSQSSMEPWNLYLILNRIDVPKYIRRHPSMTARFFTLFGQCVLGFPKTYEIYQDPNLVEKTKVVSEKLLRSFDEIIPRNSLNQNPNLFDKALWTLTRQIERLRDLAGLIMKHKLTRSSFRPQLMYILNHASIIRVCLASENRTSKHSPEIKKKLCAWTDEVFETFKKLAEEGHA